MVAVVFGARGSVGRHVAAGLAEAGVPVRRTSRSGSAEGFVAADLERPETLPAALEGADRAFIYAKPDGIDGFVAAARGAGVRHVVLLSSGAVVNPGAERNPIAVSHRTVETALEESGLEWTFIRPGMFATNTLWWWARSIRDEGRVRMPYPEAQTAPIHEKDMAALAVTAITRPGHAGQAYTIYGPESLTQRELVKHLGNAIGRDIPVEELTPDQARVELARTMPPIGVETMMRVWSSSVGVPARTSAIVPELTGRPAHTFAQWARDHVSDFSR
ncbi:NAD(P)H-binding protein [Nonomuraea sp. NPDC050536]|uniref:NAD(P)H-binding protein n=1 Tax=Nonomuraea sp. NPDC050536 TaxID=3364366 RepID=UPI0037CB8228